MRTPSFEDTLPGLGCKRRKMHSGFYARVLCRSQDRTLPPFWGVTEDICRRGLVVNAEYTPPMDSLVQLRLFTAHGELILIARVVHKLEGIGFGCRFLHLNEQQLVALRLLNSVKAAA